MKLKLNGCETVYSPDFYEKKTQGFNAVVTKKIKEVRVKERFKVGKATPQNAGRMLHTKLFCEIVSSSPNPGDRVVITIGKHKAKFVLNEERKVVQA